MNFEKNLGGVQVQVREVELFRPTMLTDTFAKLFRPTTLSQVLRTLHRETKYAASASVYAPLAYLYTGIVEKPKNIFTATWHLSFVMLKCKGQTCLNICVTGKTETKCTRPICTFCVLALA